MKKALMWSDAEACIVESQNLLEATDATATPTANAIVKATSAGKLPLTWLSTTGASDGDVIKYAALTGTLEYDAGGGSGGGVVVREIDGTPSVSGVSVIEFSNGSVADIGAGVVRVVFGGASGVASPVQKLTSVFYGDGTTTLFELPFVADEAYGVEIYTRTSANVYRRVMSDEYDSVFGVGADLSATGTVTAENGIAANAVDNNTATACVAEWHENQWVAVDFGAGNEKAIRRCKFWIDMKQGGHGRIDASADGSSWTTIALFTKTTTGWDSPWEKTITWGSAGTFRHWRLFVEYVGETFVNTNFYEIELNEATGGTSGVEFLTAPATGTRIEVTYFVAV